MRSTRKRSPRDRFLVWTFLDTVLFYSVSSFSGVQILSSDIENDKKQTPAGCELTRPTGPRIQGITVRWS